MKLVFTVYNSSRCRASINFSNYSHHEDFPLQDYQKDLGETCLHNHGKRKNKKSKKKKKASSSSSDSDAETEKRKSRKRSKKETESSESDSDSDYHKKKKKKKKKARAKSVSESRSPVSSEAEDSHRYGNILWQNEFFLATFLCECLIWFSIRNQK